MIAVTNPINEPTTFDANCRQRGAVWLAANPGSESFPSYWREFQPDLALGFGQRCGWWAMRIADGAVDHFHSKTGHRHSAYEWSNYRYIAPSVNSSKRVVDDLVLDPFEVQPGWFEVQLPGMQLVRTAALPPQLRDKADFTLQRLHLGNGPKVRRIRRLYYEDYKSGRLTFAGLSDFAPLLADAVQRWQATGQQLP